MPDVPSCPAECRHPCHEALGHQETVCQPGAALGMGFSTASPDVPIPGEHWSSGLPHGSVSSLSATRPYSASRHITHHRAVNVLTCGDAWQSGGGCCPVDLGRIAGDSMVR